jgi:hypothetical protein
MFCPQCGTSQSEEIKFCKQCGSNMYAVRQVVATREVGEKIDWSKTWVAEMFYGRQELKRRKEEAERQRGITPEMKRYNEIKGAVITSCVGIALMIFLYVLAKGIVGAGISHEAAEIISRIWVAGVIPFFVGLGMLVNGVFVSKKVVELSAQEARKATAPESIGTNTNPLPLPPADWSEPIPSNFSVTEDATRQLRNSGQKQ